MSSQPWGGSEELWSQAALHLRRCGHQVSALVSRWPQLAAPLQRLVADGIAVRMRSNLYPTGLAARAWREVRRKLFRGSRDFAWVRDQQPDFVCVSNGNFSDGLDALEFCAANHLPFASVVQANLEWLWPDDALAERLIRAYQMARRVYFVSHRNRELLEAQLGIALDHAEVVRNPFNVRWNVAVPWPKVSREWRMACVARLEPLAKGQDLLFQVLATDDWRDRPVRLSVFGKGLMENGLRRLAARLGLAERVSFHGHVADIEKVWADHHVLALPSRYEGLPLALVEAMLCGRPAIVTDVAGNAELVEDNVSGFVAAAPTLRHLGEAMERAWERRDDWENMGRVAQAAVRAVVGEKPAEAFAEKLVQLVRTLS